MGNPDSNNSTVDSKEKEENSLPRETLINHAVNFLLDKKIRDQDPSLLKRFLMKKGLTEDEVTIVFQRFETIKNQRALENGFAGQMVPSPHFLAPPPPPPPQSLWMTVHRIVTTITSIGGIVYAIYWFWKTVVSPYLFGRRPKRKPVEESLAELGAAVSSCSADLRTLRSGVDTLAAERTTEAVINSRLQEIKSEVTSLKSLLLNRNQFPATPSTGPLSIPAWQLAAESHSRAEGEGEEEGEGSGSNGGTNGSDSSLEVIPSQGK